MQEYPTEHDLLVTCEEANAINRESFVSLPKAPQPVRLYAPVSEPIDHLINEKLKRTKEKPPKPDKDEPRPPGIGVLAVVSRDGSVANFMGCVIAGNVVLTGFVGFSKSTVRVEFVVPLSKGGCMRFEVEEWRVAPPNTSISGLAVMMLRDSAASLKCGMVRLNERPSRVESSTSNAVYWLHHEEGSTYRIVKETKVKCDRPANKPCQIGGPMLAEESNPRIVGIYTTDKKPVLPVTEEMIHSINQLLLKRNVNVRPYYQEEQGSPRTFKLSQLISLSNIKEIRLASSNLGDRGAIILAMGLWPDLSVLNLNRCNLTDQGVRAISRAYWPALSRLMLVGNPFASEGLSSLANSHWPALTNLALFSANEVVRPNGTAFLQLVRCDWPFVGQHFDIRCSVSLTKEQDRALMARTGLKLFNQQALKMMMEEQQRQWRNLLMDM